MGVRRRADSSRGALHSHSADVALWHLLNVYLISYSDDLVQLDVSGIRFTSVRGCNLQNGGWRGARTEGAGGAVQARVGEW